MLLDLFLRYKKKGSPKTLMESRNLDFFSHPHPGNHSSLLEISDSLKQKFLDTQKRIGKKYHPRTHHLLADGSWAKFTNRLFLETSPYLLQHAHNPVNWFPWGDEAFELARQLNRPVLLSVGYSTCHWCHVMEEESFEDLEIAALMNSQYVCIKVDREERPDVDSIYMTAVQALTGHGGWPMTVWLTPDRKPYYGGTYFPARDGDRGARLGFGTMLTELKKAFDQQKDRIEQTSVEITRVIQNHLSQKAKEFDPSDDILGTAVKYYKGVYDQEEGGIQGPPKFPSSLPVRFLLRYAKRMGDQEVLQMATHTLEKMSRGGLFDQIGGGFHRYSTDENWLVPHFEKMLYDNALLAVAYLEAYQLTGREDFKDVVYETLDYVLREMTSPEGAFYSATDADSLTPSGKKEEGWFFTWTLQEIEEVLGKEKLEFVKKVFNATAYGNFEGRNIFHLRDSLESISSDLGMSYQAARKNLADVRKALYQARSLRPQPGRDDKVLSAWNGLMISAFARAGLALQNPTYLEAAEKAASFIFEKLWDGKVLSRTYKEGQAKIRGFLEDYAFMLQACLDLFEAQGKLLWLERALTLDQLLKSEFEDAEQGGFLMTSIYSEELLTRSKPAHDGAEPSGNSVAALNLLRLSVLTGDDDFRKRALKTFHAFGETLLGVPAVLSEMLLAIDFYVDRPKEIVLAIPGPLSFTASHQGFLAVLGKNFVPNRVFIQAFDESRLTLSRVVPYVLDKESHEGKVTAFVCEKGSCQLPVTSTSEFEKLI